MTTNLNKKANVDFSKIIIYAFLIVGAFIMLIPFYWTIATALKTEKTLYNIPPQLVPNPVTLENFKFVWTNLNFFKYTSNSFFVVFLDVFGQVLSGCVIAYGFALFKFKGRNILFILMLATMMMPSQVTMIPLYVLWNKLGFYNTYVPLFLSSYFGKAFGIYLMNQTFRSLPYSLYESARIDGANPLKILFKIYVPISIPSIVTMTIFAFIGSWNNTLGPLLYLKSENLFTLSLAMLRLNDLQAAASNVSIKMAGAAIAMVPTIIIFIFAQRQFVEGVATSGVKG